MKRQETPTGPVPTAHLAARAPESPQAARPRAFARSCCTVLAFPSRLASRCSTHGSLSGVWQGPRPCLLSQPLSPSPAKGNESPTQRPAPSFQLELWAGTRRAEGRVPREEGAPVRPETESNAASAFRLRLRWRCRGFWWLRRWGRWTVTATSPPRTLTTYVRARSGPWERGAPRPLSSNGAKFLA